MNTGRQINTDKINTDKINTLIEKLDVCSPSKKIIREILGEIVGETISSSKEPRLEISRPKNSQPARSLDAGQRKRTGEIANLMWRAFTWSDTTEGHEFWDSITQRLDQLARTGV